MLYIGNHHLFKTPFCYKMPCFLKITSVAICNEYAIDMIKKLVR